MAEERVALVGLGRMGLVLAEMTRQAGLVCTGYDRASGGSLSGTCDGATLIVLAVPLHALPTSLRELHPLLRPGQLVIDVCSVKESAERMLASELGPAGPWVGTHPLFGPNSPKQDRRAVVCTRDDSAAQQARVCAYYERLGCTVQAMSAQEHDRLMAKSQALAAVLGAALRELGLDVANGAYPPSTEPLRVLAQSQNAQPGELRDLVLYANAFAATTRAQLFTALATLDVPPDTVDVATPAAAALNACRESIDVIDRGIIDLLARRAAIAEQIARHKIVLGKSVQDLSREAMAFEARCAWAVEVGIDPDFVVKLFEQVLTWSRAVQTRVQAGEA